MYFMVLYAMYQVKLSYTKIYDFWISSCNQDIHIHNNSAHFPDMEVQIVKRVIKINYEDRSDVARYHYFSGPQ